MSKNTPTSKREVFELVYKNITALQNSYQHMLQECSRQLWTITTLEDQVRIDLEKNLVVARDAHIRLERLKYYSGLVILTEGSSLDELEISNTIDEATYLLGVAEIESNSDDVEIKSWAASKISYLEEIKNILLQILNHKIDLKLKRGLLLWQ